MASLALVVLFSRVINAAPVCAGDRYLFTEEVPRSRDARCRRRRGEEHNQWFCGRRATTTRVNIVSTKMVTYHNQRRRPRNPVAASCQTSATARHGETNFQNRAARIQHGWALSLA